MAASSDPPEVATVVRPPGVTALVIGAGLLIVVEGLLWAEFVMVFIGLFVFFMAYIVRSDPPHHVAHGAMVLVVMFMSLFYGHGGFYAGAVLGAAGGTLAIIWKPPLLDDSAGSPFPRSKG